MVPTTSAATQSSSGLPALSPARQSVQQSGGDFDANSVTLRCTAKRVTIAKPRAHVRSYDRFMLYQLKQKAQQQIQDNQANDLATSVATASNDTTKRAAFGFGDSIYSSAVTPGAHVRRVTQLPLDQLRIQEINPKRS